MKQVTGEIDYSVSVVCPHCKDHLDLTWHPYVEQDVGNTLGICVFGGKEKSAQWDNLGIEYTCEHCNKAFVLSKLEY